MPGHNFILLALRGNLLDLRGIKRQFLQLTSDAFSYFSLIWIAWVFSFPFDACSFFFFAVFTIFHGLWPGRHHFLWAHKVRVCLLNSVAASSLDKEQKLISALPIQIHSSHLLSSSFSGLLL